MNELDGMLIPIFLREDVTRIICWMADRSEGRGDDDTFDGLAIGSVGGF